MTQQSLKNQAQDIMVAVDRDLQQLDASKSPTALAEVDSRTLQSKRAAGLYLAGDNVTLALGFRYVLGMEYLFRGAPIEMYFNIAPALQLAPSTAFGIFPALGVRFTFQ